MASTSDVLSRLREKSGLPSPNFDNTKAIDVTKEYADTAAMYDGHIQRDWCDNHRDWYTIYEATDLGGRNAGIYYFEWGVDEQYNDPPIIHIGLTPEVVAWLESDIKGKWDFEWFDYGNCIYDVALAIELPIDAAHFKLTWL